MSPSPVPRLFGPFRLVNHPLPSPHLSSTHYTVSGLAQMLVPVRPDTRSLALTTHLPRRCGMSAAHDSCIGVLGSLLVLGWWTRGIGFAVRVGFMRRGPPSAANQDVSNAATKLGKPRPIWPYSQRRSFLMSERSGKLKFVTTEMGSTAEKTLQKLNEECLKAHYFSCTDKLSLSECPLPLPAAILWGKGSKGSNSSWCGHISHRSSVKFEER
ncbi:hypothetical protein B0H13DRAFT_1896883 [Mycena leptocephala]|nr:hypothetical protein B0H13DRAFT_1896883 [Mycena leptocephala]